MSCPSPALPSLAGVARRCRGAGGDTSCCPATRGHPPRARHLPRHQNCSFLFRATHEHLTSCSSAHCSAQRDEASAGALQPPGSAHVLHLQHVSRKQLQKLGRGAGQPQAGSDLRALPSSGFPCLRSEVFGSQSWTLGSGICLLSWTPRCPLAAVKSPGLR